MRVHSLRGGNLSPRDTPVFVVSAPCAKASSALNLACECQDAGYRAVGSRLRAPAAQPVTRKFDARVNSLTERATRSQQNLGVALATLERPTGINGRAPVVPENLLAPVRQEGEAFGHTPEQESN